MRTITERALGRSFFGLAGRQLGKPSRQFSTGLLLAAVGLGSTMLVPAQAEAATDRCKTSRNVLGVARTVTIDTAKGALYGNLQYKANADLLADKEVVLTFDDGPIPLRTNSVLDSLDRECTKATFFSTGRMALAYRSTVKDIMRRGHTLGTHTWSHRRDLNRISRAEAVSELERGFSAVQKAAGKPIAPFFRFPYLNDPKSLISYLGERNVGIFSIDIDSGDTRGLNASARRIIDGTMAELAKRGKGILLFHDIKKNTAEALPELLEQLRLKGFKVVHLVPKANFKSQPTFDALIEKQFGTPEAGSQETVSAAADKEKTAAVPLPAKRAASAKLPDAQLPEAKLETKPEAKPVVARVEKTPAASVVRTIPTQSPEAQSPEAQSPEAQSPEAKSAIEQAIDEKVSPAEARQTATEVVDKSPADAAPVVDTGKGSESGSGAATVTPAIEPTEPGRIPLPVRHPKPVTDRERAKSQISPIGLRGSQASVQPVSATASEPKAADATNWIDQIRSPR